MIAPWPARTRRPAAATTALRDATRTTRRRARRPSTALRDGPPGRDGPARPPALRPPTRRLPRRRRRRDGRALRWEEACRARWIWRDAHQTREPEAAAAEEAAAVEGAPATAARPKGRTSRRAAAKRPTPRSYGPAARRFLRRLTTSRWRLSGRRTRSRRPRGSARRRRGRRRRPSWEGRRRGGRRATGCCRRASPTFRSCTN